MSIRGKLKVENFGLGMPIHAAPYTYGDLAFTGIKRLVFSYYTDPLLAAAIVPEILELPDRPVAHMQFCEYENSTCGHYTELIQNLEVLYEGEKHSYAVAIYVSNDMAMMAREKFGIPKMRGSVEFDMRDSNSIVAKFERPKGLLLAQGVYSSRKYEGDFTEPVPGKSCTIRYMPPCIPGNKPDICQLVTMQTKMVAGETWSGNGTLTLTGANDEHPIHKLPVKEMLAVTWTPNGKFFMYPSQNKVVPLI